MPPDSKDANTSVNHWDFHAAVFLRQSRWVGRLCRGGAAPNPRPQVVAGGHPGWDCPSFNTPGARVKVVQRIADDRGQRRKCLLTEKPGTSTRQLEVKAAAVLRLRLIDIGSKATVEPSAFQQATPQLLLGASGAAGLQRIPQMPFW